MRAGYGYSLPISNTESSGAMSLQRYEAIEESIKEQYLEKKRQQPDLFEKKLNMSWSNWGFGLEDLAVSCDRLKRAGLEYVELHGNHYGANLGYDADYALATVRNAGLAVSGVCGMYNDDNDFSSHRAIKQQEAIEYTVRELDFTQAVGGDYLLVVPGSCGRADAYDDAEFPRSVEALRRVAHKFEETGIKGAIEPIRSAEVSFIHTVAEAIEYIEAVDSPGIQWINGDVYHMQSEEQNIPAAIVEAGDRLVNLHLADSNRLGLGDGSLNIDTMIMALYLIGHNTDGRYVTPEPLGPGAGPYAARTSIADPKALDTLVLGSVAYFRDREEYVRSL